MSGRQWPGSNIMELHQELDRLFGSMFGGWGMGGASAFGTMPQVEVCEQGTDLCVSVELPGVRQEDLDVRLIGDMLVISGEKKSSNEQQESNVHVSERSYGRFQRQVPLPFAPDPERTQASLENGVLTVRLGRLPEGAGSRRIEVRSGGQGAAPLPMEGQGVTSQGSGAGQSSAAGSTGGAGSEAGGQTRP
jgi:HSP20 family protein